MMSDRKAALWRYCLPFRSQGVVHPERQVKQDGAYRRGLVVELWQQGRQSLAEIAPLPGYSQESLAQAATQASQQLSLWARHQTMWFEDLYPSVAFGLSMALYQGNGAFSPLHQGKTARLLGLWEESDDRQLQSVHQWQSAAPVTNPGQKLHQSAKNHCAKIKVGRQSLAADIARVKAALAQVSVLRIDANRAWSLGEALAFSQAFSASQRDHIEWIEEPCQSLSDSVQFARQSHLSLALDESLHGQIPTLQSRWVSALVLKPSLIGSVARCRQWVEMAVEHQQKWMLSSSLESSLALNQIAVLSEQWHAPTLAGLDTVDCFEQQVIRPWPGCDKPLLALEQLEKVWTSAVN